MWGGTIAGDQNRMVQEQHATNPHDQQQQQQYFPPQHYPQPHSYPPQPDHHYQNQYQDDYGNEHDGALSTTVNIFASAASSIFSKGSAAAKQLAAHGQKAASQIAAAAAPPPDRPPMGHPQPPLPPPARNQHQGQPPPPLVPESYMLSTPIAQNQPQVVTQSSYSPSLNMPILNAHPSGTSQRSTFWNSSRPEPPANASSVFAAPSPGASPVQERPVFTAQGQNPPTYNALAAPALAPPALAGNMLHAASATVPRPAAVQRTDQPSKMKPPAQPSNKPLFPPPRPTPTSSLTPPSSPYVGQTQLSLPAPRRTPMSLPKPKLPSPSRASPKVVKKWGGFKLPTPARHDVSLPPTPVISNQKPMKAETTDVGVALSESSVKEDEKGTCPRPVDVANQDVRVPRKPQADPKIAALPSGWIEHKDPISGRAYYLNSSTEETTWVSPVHSEPFQAENVPPPISNDQKTVKDEASGDTATEPPLIDAPGDALPPDRKDTLPDGWLEQLDPNSNRPYYLDQTTGETAWERPVAGVVSPDANDEPEAVLGHNSVVIDASRLNQVATAQSNDGPEIGEIPSQPESTEQQIEQIGPETLEQESCVTQKHVHEAASPLLDGWTELVDAISGRQYYLNQESGETTWSRPVLGTTVAFAIKDMASPKDETTPATKKEQNQDEIPVGETYDSEEATSSERASDSALTLETPQDMLLPKQASDSVLAVETTHGGFLPEGWTEQVDQSTGMNYYFNAITNEATWERPPAAATKFSTVVTFSVAQTSTCVLMGQQPLSQDPETEIEEEENGDLPAGWSSELDRTSGNLYYFNSETGETRWDPPPSSLVDSHHECMNPEDTSEPIPDHVEDEGEERQLAMEPHATDDMPEATAPATSFNESVSNGQNDASWHETLPRGLGEITDSTTGLTYHYSETTKTTSWEKPTYSAVDGGDGEDTPTLDMTMDEKDLTVDEIRNDVDEAGPLDVDGGGANVSDEKALPPGWSQIIDPSTGRPYFFNELTQEMSWEKPNSRAEEATGLSRHGDAGEEPDADVTFDEKDTTMNQIRDDFGEIAALDVDDGGRSDEVGELPPGWQKVVDEGSGRYVYFHPDDPIETRSWEPPLHHKETSVLSAIDESCIADELPAGNIREIEARSDIRPTSVDATAHVGKDEHGTMDGLHRAAESSGGELPEGWSEVLDEASGNVYFFNKFTGESSWERPQTKGSVGKAMELPEALGAGSGMTEQELDVFDVTHTSSDEKVSTGEKEKNVNELVETLEEANPESANVHAEETLMIYQESDLPEGWEELVDPNTGTSYYFNQMDNSTTWERPQKPKLLKAEVDMELKAIQLEASAEPESEVDNRIAEAGHAPEEEREGQSDVAKAEEPELPTGWVQMFDDLSGKHYYFNQVDSRATWECPVGANENALGMIQNDSNPETTDEFVAESFHEDEGELNINSETDQVVDETEPESEIIFPEKVEEASKRVLPPGWMELTDPTSGGHYYFNENENITTWEYPAVDALNRRDAKALVPTDDEATSPVHTEESNGVDETEPESEIIFPEKVEEASKRVLPLGWMELTDPTSGGHYYFNENENITTWEYPAVDALNRRGAKALVSTDDEATSPVHTEESNGALDTTYHLPVHPESKARNMVSRPDEVFVSEEATETSDKHHEDSLLPEGWVEMIDSSSGLPYYFNEAEESTTWDRPGSRAAKEEYQGETRKKPKAYETTTSQTGEEIGEFPADADLDEGVDDKESKEVMDIIKSGLPAGWIELTDPSSGNTYYFNEAENRTTWDRPIGGHSTVPKHRDEDLVDLDNTVRVASGPAQVIRKTDDAVDVPSFSSRPHAKDSVEPASEPRIDEATVEQATVNNTREPDSSRADLPIGWVKLVDPSSGNPFYFNEELNVTSLEYPTSGLGKKGETSGRAFVSFGFGGKVCIFRVNSGRRIEIHKLRHQAPSHPIALEEAKKRKHHIVGALNDADNESVSSYIEEKARGSEDLLWSLIRIASQTGGRLRSDEGVADISSPESAVIQLMLRAESGSSGENGGHSDVYEAPEKESLLRLESLLLHGKREEAVHEAIVGRHFGLALLVASMCDRKTFQHATKMFAEVTLVDGSPLHTLALLFSGQLEPPSDLALDRSGLEPTVWSRSTDELLSSWKKQLCALISNRILGWDRIVLSLGDRLLDLGNTHAAHCCYMICGCPVTSILHPSSRLSLIGCDHLVPLDAALQTEVGIAAYCRSEAHEWAKRQGNPEACIRSLQGFKLAYAMMLADFGFKDAAAAYVNSIRQSTGHKTECTSSVFVSGKSPTVWTLAEPVHLASFLDEFESRLLFEDNQFNLAGSQSRKQEVRGLSSTKRRVMDQPPPMTAPAMISVPKNHTETDVSFLSGKSNLFEGRSPAVSKHTMPSATEGKAAATSDDGPISPGTEPPKVTLSNAAKETPIIIAETTSQHAVGPSATSLPPSTPGYSVASPSFAMVSPPAGKQEKRRSIVSPLPSESGAPIHSKTNLQPSKPERAPNSAPAELQRIKSPDKAPTSAQRHSWGLGGFRDRMTKWLNPDATTADLGEGMQAYYDEKRKVWVFPGDNPDEVAKPVGPPPIPTKTPQKEEEEDRKEEPSGPKNPLDLMMAPPPRSVTSMRRPGGTNPRPAFNPSMMMPPGSGIPVSPPAAGGPPKFMVFTPKNEDSKQQEDTEKED